MRLPTVCLCVVISLAATGVNATAQQFDAYAAAQKPTIVVHGTAALPVAPEYVEFTLTHELRAATCEEAQQRIAQFGPQLHELAAARELKPQQFTISDPLFIASISRKDTDVAARVNAVLRFPLTAVEESLDRTRLFARICDQVSELAKATDCAMSGPKLGVENPLVTEKAAIAKAIEKAYPHAEGAAGILPALVTAVNEISILMVQWEGGEGQSAAGANPAEIVCTAKVRVTYTFE